MTLNSFTYYRALAIFFIVAAHSYELARVSSDSMFNSFFMNIISGGTALFVFISGFLFHHVFYPKYNFEKFIKGKLRNLFIPYFLLGILPIAYHVYTQNSHWGGYFFSGEQSFYERFILPIIKYYFTGRFLVAYWYIVFAMILFLLSPLHVVYIKQKKFLQLVILGVFLIIGLLVGRPAYDLNPMQAIMYYMPVYLFGILCSQYKVTIYTALKGKDGLLAACCLLLAFVQSYLGNTGFLTKPFFNYDGIDINLIQKLCLCLFFMIWLHRFENIEIKPLQLLAATSFAVYFIHAYLLGVIWVLVPSKHLIQQESWLAFFGFVFLIIFISVAIASLVKKILPRHSRFITGY
ncbi:acyltransferase [Endozoicomonas sp. 8E]|uniref:acyltransferase family protein n=1 Tax=Endozoicomonas sp. 8E TaxID=3035692 RepID=UPI0029394795|nr:acyltransferase [Endozoicomonas sp. 8E]WOG27221.1 acyltransferase [Endozoicomonas sp. 8E]